MHRLALAALLSLSLGLTGSAQAGGKDKVLFGKIDSLVESDAKDTKLKASRCKIYTVKLEAGVAYRIDLSSKDFDTFLRLVDSTGKEVAFNDDVDLAAKNLDSRIIYIPAKAGEFKLVVTTFKAAATGNFVLEMVRANDAEAAEARIDNQIETFAKLSAEDRKKLVLTVTKGLHDRGAKLNQADGMRAFKLGMELEIEDLKLARETYKDFVKTFAGAENERIASFAKFFNGALDNLDKLGKEIEIAGKTTEGKDFDLKNLKGKVVLVDFWATWCGPCLAEIPNMVNAHKKYHGKGFEIIGLSLDRDADKLSKFMEVRKLPWNSINIEDSRKWATKYSVRAIPHAVLVDRDGRVVSFRARGPMLERLLERMIDEKK